MKKKLLITIIIAAVCLSAVVASVLIVNSVRKNAGGGDVTEATEAITSEVTEAITSEITEPVTTEPVTTPETEPAATEPAATEPVVTEPAVTEPAVTEPVVTEPAVTEPAVTEPAVTEPEITEPVTPETTEPEVTEVIVTFVTDGSSVEAVKLNKGEKLASLPPTLRNGYSFEGWYVDSACKQPFYTDVPVDNDLTLYAGFTELEDDVTYYPEVDFYVDDCAPTFSLTLLSDKPITEDNLFDFIEFDAHGNAFPALDVTPVEGGYKLSDRGGFEPGRYYTVTSLGDVKFKDVDEGISNYTFRIFRERSETVELKDNVKFIDVREIEAKSDKYTYLFPKVLVELNKLSVGDVLCIGNGLRLEDDDNAFFVNVLDITEQPDGDSIIHVEDSSPSDVFENIDVFITEAITNSVYQQALDPDEIIESIRSSEGFERFSMLLGAACNTSPTVKLLGTGSKNDPTDFTKNAGIKDEALVLEVEGWAQGVTISATIGKAYNNNFNPGFPPEEGWYVADVTLEYNKQIKNHVKIKAVVTLRVYLNMYIMGSTDLDWDAIDFDLSLYSFTQVDFIMTVYACSTDSNSKLKGTKQIDGDMWFDITDEVTGLINGESEESQDSLMKRMIEMLKADGGEILLAKPRLLLVQIPVVPLIHVFDVNLEFYFNIKFDFAVALESRFSILDCSMIGLAGNTETEEYSATHKKLEYGTRYSYNLEACGYLGMRIGLEGDVTISFARLRKLGEVGFGVELGAYAKLYGYLQLSIVKEHSYSNPSVTYRGGYYFEVGLYVDIKVLARSELFHAEADLHLYKHDFPLFTAGNKEALVGFTDTSGTYFMNEESAKLKDVLPLTSNNLNLTTGEYSNKNVLADSKCTLQFSNNLFTFNKDTGVISVNKAALNGAHSAEATVYVFYNGQSFYFTNENSRTLDSEYKRNEFKNAVAVYKLVWVDKSIGMTAEDYGKTVTATYVIDIEGIRTTLGRRDVLAGSAPGVWSLGRTYRDGYDIGEWNKDVSLPIVDDTEYVITARYNEVGVGFVWFDGTKWCTKVVAVTTGETPAVPSEFARENSFGTFVNWSVYPVADWSYTYSEGGYTIVTHSTNLILKTDELYSVQQYWSQKKGYFFNTTSNGDLLFTGSSNSAINAVNALKAAQQNGEIKTADGETGCLYDIYVANYTFNKYDVKFVSYANKGLTSELEEFTETQKVSYGEQPKYSGYHMPYGGEIDDSRPAGAAGEVWSGWTWYRGYEELPSKPATMGDYDIIAKSTSEEVYVWYKVDIDGRTDTFHKEKAAVGAEVRLFIDYYKLGYTATGWTTTDVSVADGKFTMPEKDVIFHATATPIDYRIITSVNGTETVISSSAHVDTEITMPAAPEDPPGYTFGGWKSSWDKKTYQPGDTVTMEMADLTLTAIFNKTGLVVSYVLDGQVVHTESYEEGTTFTTWYPEEYEDWEKDECFSGWVASVGFFGWADETGDQTYVMPGCDVTMTGWITVGNIYVTVEIEDYVWTYFGQVRSHEIVNELYFAYYEGDTVTLPEELLPEGYSVQPFDPDWTSADNWLLWDEDYNFYVSDTGMKLKYPIGDSQYSLEDYDGQPFVAEVSWYDLRISVTQDYKLHFMANGTEIRTQYVSVADSLTTEYSSLQAPTADELYAFGIYDYCFRCWWPGGVLVTDGYLDFSLNGGFGNEAMDIYLTALEYKTGEGLMDLNIYVGHESGWNEGFAECPVYLTFASSSTKIFTLIPCQMLANVNLPVLYRLEYVVGENSYDLTPEGDIDLVFFDMSEFVPDISAYESGGYFNLYIDWEMCG